MVDSNLPPPRAQQSSRGMATGEVTLPLLTAFQRLIDLLAEPKDIPILAPIIQREIFYRLLVGDQGARLRQMASAGSQSHQIARAIDWLKGNFTRPLRIDDLAAQVHMSTSTFHHHFRALTAMSPLQYQKWLRLNEARRLMLTERLDAATAAFQVGYESPSQFSREYSRLFGAAAVTRHHVLASNGGQCVSPRLQSIYWTVPAEGVLDLVATWALSQCACDSPNDEVDVGNGEGMGKVCHRSAAPARTLSQALQGEGMGMLSCYP